MPFNTLLLTSLIHGTSFSEGRCQVRLCLEPGETVLFFVVDDQSNPDCTLRQDFGVTGSICDLVVFYVRGHNKVICLVELKGSDIERAIEQVTSTRRFLQESLRQLAKCKEFRSHLRQIEWKAYIHPHGSVPRDTKRLCKPLQQDFGKGNFDISRKEDLGEFLRS